MCVVDARMGWILGSKDAEKWAACSDMEFKAGNAIGAASSFPTDMLRTQKSNRPSLYIQCRPVSRLHLPHPKAKNVAKSHCAARYAAIFLKAGGSVKTLKPRRPHRASDLHQDFGLVPVTWIWEANDKSVNGRSATSSFPGNKL